MPIKNTILAFEKVLNYIIFKFMIVCSKSPLEEVFSNKTTLDFDQRLELISWVDSYVDTMNPDLMMLVDLSSKEGCVYEKCFNPIGNCEADCCIGSLIDNVVEEQRDTIKLVDDELSEFAIANLIPVRSCSFNLRFNVVYPNKKAITFLRSVIILTNNDDGSPALALVLIEDITKMTNAVQGAYFEIKCMRQSNDMTPKFKFLEDTINNKIKPGVILTKRENQILQLLIKGYTSLEISNEFFIAKTTVDKHRQNLMRKYNVGNVTQLIRKYLQSVN